MRTRLSLVSSMLHIEAGDNRPLYTRVCYHELPNAKIHAPSLKTQQCSEVATAAKFSPTSSLQAERSLSQQAQGGHHNGLCGNNCQFSCACMKVGHVKPHPSPQCPCGPVNPWLGSSRPGPFCSTRHSPAHPQLWTICSRCWRGFARANCFCQRSAVSRLPRLLRRRFEEHRAGVCRWSSPCGCQRLRSACWGVFATATRRD
jgi:hypothetical protein